MIKYYNYQSDHSNHFFHFLQDAAVKVLSTVSYRTLNSILPVSFQIHFAINLSLLMPSMLWLCMTCQLRYANSVVCFGEITIQVIFHHVYWVFILQKVIIFSHIFKLSSVTVKLLNYFNRKCALVIQAYVGRLSDP